MNTRPASQGAWWTNSSKESNSWSPMIDLGARRVLLAVLVDDHATAVDGDLRVHVAVRSAAAVGGGHRGCGLARRGGQRWRGGVRRRRRRRGRPPAPGPGPRRGVAPRGRQAGASGERSGARRAAAITPAARARPRTGRRQGGRYTRWTWFKRVSLIVICSLDAPTVPSGFARKHRLPPDGASGPPERDPVAGVGGKSCVLLSSARSIRPTIPRVSSRATSPPPRWPVRPSIRALATDACSRFAGSPSSRRSLPA